MLLRVIWPSSNLNGQFCLFLFALIDITHPSSLFHNMINGTVYLFDDIFAMTRLPFAQIIWWMNQLSKSVSDMGLRDIELTLPPGFRFYPSDEELVCHYLYKKVANLKVYEGTMVEVDLHTREPWELPEGAKLSDNEWYFFSFRDRKYATGSRTNRATKSGYWKATGKDRTVYHPMTRAIVGMRKTLVFYTGRAPNGMKTAWVMHEFRLENPHTPPKEDWVLCRVFHKRKGEPVTYRLENEQEVGFPTSYMESSPNSLIGQSMLDGCCEIVGSSLPTVPHPEGNINSSNTLLNLAVLHYNLLDFPQEELDPTAMMGTGMGSMESKYDDYGFLLDTGLDDHGLVGTRV